MDNKYLVKTNSFPGVGYIFSFSFKAENQKWFRIQIIKIHHSQKLLWVWINIKPFSDYISLLLNLLFYMILSLSWAWYLVNLIRDKFTWKIDNLIWINEEIIIKVTDFVSVLLFWFLGKPKQLPELFSFFTLFDLDYCLRGFFIILKLFYVGISSW